MAVSKLRVSLRKGGIDGNRPFIDGYGLKPLGANFYPVDMTKEEFEQAELSGKDGLYTFLRRDEGGKLKTVPYHQQFAEQFKRASELLRKSAELAADGGLRRYLLLRADALLTDESVTIDLTSGVEVNGASVTSANILTSNGVIHVVDAVLVP